VDPPPLPGSVRLDVLVSASVPSPVHIVDPVHEFEGTIPLRQKTKKTRNRSEKVVIRVTIPNLSYEISACRMSTVNQMKKRVALV
jgi:hypothetical protein